MLAFVAAAAGIGALAVGLAQTAIVGTLAYGADDSPDVGVVGALSDLEQILSPGVIVFPLAVVVACASAAALRGALPRRLGVYGAVLSVGLLAGGSVLFADGDTFGLGGDFTAIVRAGLLVWIVATSVALMRGPRHQATPAADPAPNPA